MRYRYRSTLTLRTRSVAVGLSLATIAQTSPAQRGPALPRPVETDSAGVRIVTYSDLGQLSEAFRLTAAPTVTIGALGDDPRSEFTRLINAATRLGDGRIVVAMWADTSLRVFDYTGTYVASFGRRGTGPGEFQMIVGFCRSAGDTLVVVDDSQRRITRFDPQGRHLSTGAIDASTSGMPPLCLDDGSAALRTPMSTLDRPPPTAADPRVRYRLTHLSLVPRPTVLHALDGIPGNDRALRISDSPIVTVGQPFGRQTSVATDGSTIHVAEGSAYEIHSHSPTLRLVRVLRVTQPGSPVTETLRRAYRDSALARSTPARRDAMAAVLDDGAFPATVPPYSRILVDGARRLWVERYLMPGDTARTWTVFDHDARVLGRVVIPMGLVIGEVGTDYVLGWRTTTDQGIAHRQIQLYGLVPR